jgi:hypothetical protein
MKMMVVTWGGQHYVFAYANELATESQPDQREVIICEMSDHIDQLTAENELLRSQDMKIQKGWNKLTAERDRYKAALENIAAKTCPELDYTFEQAQHVASEALEPK